MTRRRARVFETIEDANTNRIFPDVITIVYVRGHVSEMLNLSAECAKIDAMNGARVSSRTFDELNRESMLRTIFEKRRYKTHAEREAQHTRTLVP